MLKWASSLKYQLHYGLSVLTIDPPCMRMEYNNCNPSGTQRQTRSGGRGGGGGGGAKSGRRHQNRSPSNKPVSTPPQPRSCRSHGATPTATTTTTTRSDSHLRRETDWQQQRTSDFKTNLPPQYQQNQSGVSSMDPLAPNYLYSPFYQQSVFYPGFEQYYYAQYAGPQSPFSMYGGYMDPSGYQLYQNPQTQNSTIQPASFDNHTLRGSVDEGGGRPKEPQQQEMERGDEWPLESEEFGGRGTVTEGHGTRSERKNTARREPSPLVDIQQTAGHSHSSVKPAAHTGVTTAPTAVTEMSTAAGGNGVVRPERPFGRGDSSSPRVSRPYEPSSGTEKKMMILRGLPGSGKSTLAR